MAPAIFLIDPDYCSRTVVRFHLAQAGYAVYDGDAPAALPAGVQPQLLVVDELAQHASGQALLEALGPWTSVPLLVITHLPAPSSHAFRTAHLTRPILRSSLLAFVQSLLAIAPAQRVEILHPAV